MHCFRKMLTLLSAMLLLMAPSAGSALRIGEYIPLTASVSTETLTGSEESGSEEYQFENTNTTDTNIDTSGSELIGYGEHQYPVTVAFAGDITDISPEQYPDIYQFEQELLVEGSEISKLFEIYKAGGMTPGDRTRLPNVWNCPLTQVRIP